VGRMNPSLGRKAAALPVYLVNPAQMDRLYPPERRRTFCDPERVRRALRDLRSRGEEGERGRRLLWEALRDGSECDLFRHTVAVGLYMGSMRGVSKGSILGLGDPGHQDPGAPPAFQADPGPAIFLCPERIVDWGAREGVSTALVQDQFYYHELAHALMDTADTAPDPYQEPWGLVVEESLANWVAASRFQGSEALAVHRLIKGQPPKYLGYEAVSWLVFSLVSPSKGTSFSGKTSLKTSLSIYGGATLFGEMSLKTSSGLCVGAIGRFFSLFLSPSSLFLSRKGRAWPD
jgi:hypothetical protein